jgi:hypothetical protein
MHVPSMENSASYTKLITIFWVNSEFQFLGKLYYWIGAPILYFCSQMSELRQECKTRDNMVITTRVQRFWPFLRRWSVWTQGYMKKLILRQMLKKHVLFLFEPPVRVLFQNLLNCYYHCTIINHKKDNRDRKHKIWCWLWNSWESCKTMKNYKKDICSFSPFSILCQSFGL